MSTHVCVAIIFIFESECYRQKRSFDSSGALVSNATKNLCTDAVPTIFNLAAFSSGMCDAPASSSNVEKSGERKRRLAVRTRKQQHTEVGLFTSYLPNTGSISKATRCTQLCFGLVLFLI